jgi:hypothetical protein
LVAEGSCGGDAFGGANEIFGSLKVEEVEVDDVVIFRGFEDFGGYAVGKLGVLIDGVEEFKEELEWY